MKIFGSSPVTSILGYIIIVATVTKEVLAGGLPSDAGGWIQDALQIIMGVALRFAKDSNVSNAPVPAAAQPVK